MVLRHGTHPQSVRPGVAGNLHFSSPARRRFTMGCPGDEESPQWLSNPITAPSKNYVPLGEKHMNQSREGGGEEEAVWLWDGIEKESPREGRPLHDRSGRRSRGGKAGDSFPAYGSLWSISRIFWATYSLNFASPWSITVHIWSRFRKSLPLARTTLWVVRP